MNKRKCFIIMALIIVLLGFGYCFSIVSQNTNDLPMEQIESLPEIIGTERHVFISD